MAKVLNPLIQIVEVYVDSGKVGVVNRLKVFVSNEEGYPACIEGLPQGPANPCPHLGETEVAVGKMDNLEDILQILACQESQIFVFQAPTPIVVYF